MKNDDLYTEYLMYLDWRLQEKQINKGKWALLKMSKSSFEDFKYKLENEEHFNKKIVELVRAETRDKKIEEIIEEEPVVEVDDFFDDLDDINIDEDNKIDDIFDDLDF